MGEPGAVTKKKKRFDDFLKKWSQETPIAAVIKMSPWDANSVYWLVWDSVKIDDALHMKIKKEANGETGS